MTNSDFRCHTPSLFFDLNLLTITDIFNLKSAISIHNIQHNNFTGSSNLIPLKHIHQHNTRLSSKNNFYQQQVVTNLGRSTFSSAGIKFWRSIPEDIKCSNLPLFKTKLNTIQYKVTNELKI